MYAYDCRILNDTIVVFDRIRENKAKATSRTSLAEIINKSITETLSRSINTSVTTFIMVFVLAVFGVDSVRQFAIPLIVGIISGCYSSVCVASPLWYVLSGKGEKEQKAVTYSKKKKFFVNKYWNKKRRNYKSGNSNVHANDSFFFFV